MAETASDILARLRQANVQRQNVLGQQSSLSQNGMALTPGLNRAIRHSNLTPSQRNDQGFTQILGQATRNVDARNIDATKTQRLQDTLNRQRADLENVHQMEAPTPQEDTGIIPRLFDLLLRPQYAIMEGLRAQQETIHEGGNPLEGFASAARGAREGFTGRAKTEFADILTDAQEQTGIDLPRFVTGGLGFIGDVALDPLTYTGFGILKKGGAVVADQAAAKGLKEAQKQVTSKSAKLAANREARAAGKRAIEDLLEKRAKKNVLATKEEINLVRKSASSKAREEIAKRKKEQLFKAMKEAADNSVVNDAGKLQLKLLGKPVLEGGEKFYNMAGTITKPLTDTQMFKNINEFFRPQATFPGLLNELKRSKEGAGVARWSMEAENFRHLANGGDEAFGKIAPDDAARLTHALERGDKLLGEVGSEGADLEKWVRHLRKAFDDLFDDELARGILSKDQWRDGYVPHYFRGGKKDEINKWKNNRRKVVGTESPGFAKQRTLEGTLLDAKEKGLTPIEDVREVYLERLKKHHNVVARDEFVKKAASTYGVKLSGKGSKLAKQVADEYGLVPLKSKFAEDGIYVPKRIAEAVNKLEDIFTHDELVGDFLKVFDRYQNGWKMLATVVNPGHHVRNGLGDVYLNYLDGVVNPRRYEQSAKIIKAMQRSADPTLKSQKTIKIGDTAYSPEEIMRQYRETGLKAGWYQTEFGRPTDIIAPGGKIGEAAGKAERGLRHLSEMREEFTRMAHFVDVLVKEGKGIKPGKNRLIDLEKISEKAAARVRKWNIDYGDFTPQEMKIMKRAMPFYSFMRKNMPLQLEALFLRPGKVAGIPKVNTAIERLLGTNEGEPWEEDRIPQWIQDLSAVRVMGGNEPAFLTVGTPFHDLARLEGVKDIFLDGDIMQGSGEVLRDTLSMTTPILKGLAEIGFQRSAFTGAPLRSGGAFAAGQVPLTRVMYQIATAEDPRDAAKTLANWVANLGFQQATYQRQSGELRRQQDVVQQLLQQSRADAGMGPR